MKIKATRAEKTFDFFNILIVSLLALVCLYPMYYVFINSFSSASAVARGEVTILPRGFSLASYRSIFDNASFLHSMGNTMIYTVLGTAISLILCVLCAYPLSVRTFSGRKVFTILITFTMFFNGGLIPTYLVVKSMGMLDSIWAMVIPAAISTYNVIIIRTFFQSISGEMRESAYIDGANDLVILFRIMIPLSMPVLATITLFCAVTHWNGFMPALLYLNDKTKYPMQMILRNMLIAEQMSEQYANIAGEMEILPETLKYASIIISTAPILFVYPFLQRYFVKGVMIGSVKG